jgi:HPt (histidine-containing phosphotransfer) domain-containing protein
LLDREALLARVEGDSALLGELIGLFHDDYRRLREAIGEGLRRGDADAVRQAAHTLKGAAGNFTTGKPFVLARALEQASADGDLAGAARLWAELAVLVDALDAELTGLAPARGGTP